MKIYIKKYILTLCLKYTNLSLYFFIFKKIDLNK